MKKLLILLAILISLASCEKENKDIRKLETKEVIQEEEILPVANFKFSPTMIFAGDNVSFVNTSEFAENCLWIICHESTYTTCSGYDIEFIFDSDGTYTVILIVSNKYGLSTKIENIFVNK